MSKLLRTQVQLTPEQLAQLRSLAVERRDSVAGLIREAVGLLLSNTDSAASRNDRARAAVGAFASNHYNIGERHDEYLAEDFGR